MTRKRSYMLSCGYSRNKFSKINGYSWITSKEHHEKCFSRYDLLQSNIYKISIINTQKLPEILKRSYNVCVGNSFSEESCAKNKKNVLNVSWKFNSNGYSWKTWWFLLFLYCFSGCFGLVHYRRSGSEASWVGHDFHTYPHPDKTPIEPRDIMVDVVNILGLKLLAIHNENNEDNIAISPYGALSIIVALGEGLQGEAVRELQIAAHIPNDISVIRVGLRDIHRHLKSYFIPKEGFLAGLTLNHDNVTLRPEYEEILKFYGFDIMSFNNGLYPDPLTTEHPFMTTTIEHAKEMTMEMTSPTTVTTSRTEKPDTTFLSTTISKDTSTETEKPTTTETTEDIITVSTTSTEPTTITTTMITTTEPSTTPTVTEIVSTTTKLPSTTIQTTTETSTTLTVTEVVSTTTKLPTTTIQTTTETSLETSTPIYTSDITAYTPAGDSLVVESTTMENLKTTRDVQDITTNSPTTKVSTITEPITDENTFMSSIQTITTVQTTQISEMTKDITTTDTISEMFETTEESTTLQNDLDVVMVEGDQGATIAVITTTTESTTEAATVAETNTLPTTSATTTLKMTDSPKIVTELLSTETVTMELLTTEDVSTETILPETPTTEFIETIFTTEAISTETIVPVSTTETIAMQTTFTTERTVPITSSTESVSTEPATPEATTITDTTMSETSTTDVMLEKAVTEELAETTTLLSYPYPEAVTPDNDISKEVITENEIGTKETQAAIIKRKARSKSNRIEVSKLKNKLRSTFKTDFNENTNNYRIKRSLNNSKRKSRSVVDYMIARYYDDHYSQTNHHLHPYVPQTQPSFLVQGKYREYQVEFMKYDTVLPFYYVSYLKTLALSFPLDSPKYYLLLLLPMNQNGIDKLICDLRLNGSLKYIINNLRYRHITALIPSFMLKGYVNLTPTFQKLGIRRVFEPRQADFTPMTSFKELYVTNIEQAITVNIRNYVDPEAFTNRREFHQEQPIEFRADHPFLYFVIDTELHVTLMAGKVVNPLNTRIT